MELRLVARICQLRHARVAQHGVQPFVIGAAALVEVVAPGRIFHELEEPGQVVARLHLDTAFLAYPDVFLRHAVEPVEHGLRAAVQPEPERETRLPALEIHGKALVPPADGLHELHKIVLGLLFVLAAVAHAVGDVRINGQINPAPLFEIAAQKLCERAYLFAVVEIRDRAPRRIVQVTGQGGQLFFQQHQRGDEPVPVVHAGKLMAPAVVGLHFAPHVGLHIVFFLMPCHKEHVRLCVDFSELHGYFVSSRKQGRRTSPAYDLAYQRS